jgi:preprotein translocase subunit YajC
VPSLIILLGMFVLLWAVLIRPQRAKQRLQQQMLSQIDPGDEILTVGGIYGIVVEVEDDDDLVVEIADGIHVRIARRAVATVVKPEEDEDEDAEAGEDDDEIVDVDADEEAVAGEAEAEGLVTVPDTEATIEATQRRLFRRR